MLELLDFLSPRLDGGSRFKQHTIPLELLADLAVFQELLLETAKWCYLETNVDKSRLPNGFGQGFSVDLVGIEEGSSVPRIAILAAAAGQLFSNDPHLPYFEAARDRIVAAVAAAESNGDVTEHLPPHLLHYFERIGSHLRDDEELSLRPKDVVAPSRLNRMTRERLRLASKSARSSEDVVRRGTIPGIQQEKLTFDLHVLNGPVFTVEIPPLFRRVIDTAFHKWNEGVRVKVSGVGSYDRHGRLEGIESVTEVMILDPKDVPSQLADLIELKDGWLDGKGKAPLSSGLNWLSKRFDDGYPTNLVLPFTYPTPEGGVQFEWSIGDIEASLEIDLSKRIGEWHCLNLKTDDEEARTLDLNSDDGWGEFISLVRNITGGRT